MDTEVGAFDLSHPLGEPTAHPLKRLDLECPWIAQGARREWPETPARRARATPFGGPSGRLMRQPARSG